MSHERHQVAEVFGLTGSDFEDAPWTPSYVSDSGETRPFGYTYWYTGVPDYASELDNAAEIRTVCRDEIFGQVPDAVTDESGTWRVVARFSNSGETECPGDYIHIPLPCPLCEETNAHGYIYIGDGWSEIVYQLDVAPVRYLQAISRSTMHKWHAIPEDTNIWPTFSRAICGATVINPPSIRYFDGMQDQYACKRCLAVAQARKGF